MLDSNVFNTEKSDYKTHRSLFLGEAPGLFDTIHRQNPEIWKEYKSMKSLDWDEVEFDFTTCNVEFKTRPKSITDRMIKTIAWQWEADSVAARMILPVAAPFITSSELLAAWACITANEVVHGSAYSEMTRQSFDDPDQVFKEVLEVTEAMQRLKTVSDVFGRIYRVSHEYALGLRENNQETYNAAFMLPIVLLVMERIQFMASFAVTFAIGETGAFMPIAKTVQKICQDEYEVHVAVDKLVIEHELKTERGKKAFEMQRDEIVKLIDEVVESELKWVDYLLEGEHLVGLTPDLLKQWVLYSAGDVYRFLNIKTHHSIPKHNPLAYMANWMDISKTQPAPQEQALGMYRVNVIQRNDSDMTFDIDW